MKRALLGVLLALTGATVLAASNPTSVPTKEFAAVVSRTASNELPSGVYATDQTLTPQPASLIDPTPSPAAGPTDSPAPDNANGAVFADVHAGVAYTLNPGDTLRGFDDSICIDPRNDGYGYVSSTPPQSVEVVFKPRTVAGQAYATKLLIRDSGKPLYACAQGVLYPRRTESITLSLNEGAGRPDQTATTHFVIPAAPTPLAPPAHGRAGFIGSLQNINGACTKSGNYQLSYGGQYACRDALQALVNWGVQFIRSGNFVAASIDRDCTPAGYRADGGFDSVEKYTIANTLRHGINVLYKIEVKNPPSCAQTDGNGMFEYPGRPGDDETKSYQTTIVTGPDAGKHLQSYGNHCRNVAMNLLKVWPKIRYVEIGTNEPNFSSNWPNPKTASDGIDALMALPTGTLADSSGPGIAPYLKDCYRNIKAVYPTLQVVAPGFLVGGSALEHFMTALYKEGCGYGRCWDVFGIHNYPAGDPGNAPKTMPAIQHAADCGGTTSEGAFCPTYFVHKYIQSIMAQYESPSTPLLIGETENGIPSAVRNPTVKAYAPEVRTYFTSELLTALMADPTVVFWTQADIESQDGSPYFKGITCSNTDHTPSGLQTARDTECPLLRTYARAPATPMPVATPWRSPPPMGAPKTR